jgi:hypothetical protein
MAPSDRLAPACVALVFRLFRSRRSSTVQDISKWIGTVVSLSKIEPTMRSPKPMSGFHPFQSLGLLRALCMKASPAYRLTSTRLPRRGGYQVHKLQKHREIRLRVLFVVWTKSRLFAHGRPKKKELLYQGALPRYKDLHETPDPASRLAFEDA